jgi:hypothetical protein
MSIIGKLCTAYQREKSRVKLGKWGNEISRYLEGCHFNIRFSICAVGRTLYYNL